MIFCKEWKYAEVCTFFNDNRGAAKSQNKNWQQNEKEANKKKRLSAEAESQDIIACFLTLATANAAEKYDKSDNDYPSTIIVKEVAKTVIHNESSLKYSSCFFMNCSALSLSSMPYNFKSTTFPAFPAVIEPYVSSSCLISKYKKQEKPINEIILLCMV